MIRNANSFVGGKKKIFCDIFQSKVKKKMSGCPLSLILEIQPILFPEIYCNNVLIIFFFSLTNFFFTT